MKCKKHGVEMTMDFDARDVETGEFFCGKCINEQAINNFERNG